MKYECLFDYGDIQIWKNDKDLILIDTLKGDKFTITGVTEEELKALQKHGQQNKK